MSYNDNIKPMRQDSQINTLNLSVSDSEDLIDNY